MVPQATPGHGLRYIPIELPDGPQSTDIATAAWQNGEVVGMQGKKKHSVGNFGSENGGWSPSRKNNIK